MHTPDRSLEIAVCEGAGTRLVVLRPEQRLQGNFLQLVLDFLVQFLLLVGWDVM
jgi:hypothetical protein